ncbi:MAG TPA: TrkA C-terminal domain-containing protein [Methanomassiliicoccales archaeon]|nr:potassium transporter TrkA [Methanomassiliicoccales archaeon]HQN76438.1 TrkA C-terminal domain-containing protein [Methanomassiliicoccales archaeon]
MYDLGREQRLDKYDLAHATVREILTEMKDISEIMVDLAYASIMFDSEEIAEEVKNLEEDMEELSKNIRIKTMLSARTHKDATKLSSLLEVAAASRRISNAAGDIVKLMECEVDKRPFLTFILREAEEKIKRLVLADSSDMVGRQIGDLGVESETGMRIIAIKRGKRWIYDPEEETKLKAGDTLIVRGTDDGYDVLRSFANGDEKWPVYPEEEEEED